MKPHFPEIKISEHEKHNLQPYYSLETLISLPVHRRTNFLEQCKRLMLSTPCHHNDYDNLRHIIRKTLEESRDPNHKHKARARKVKNIGSCQFVKSSVMVEYRSGKRKLVQVVLLSDYLAAVKYEDPFSSGSSSYKLRPNDIRWVFRINEIRVDNAPENVVDCGIESSELNERRQLLLQYKQDMIKPSQELRNNSSGKVSKSQRKSLLKEIERLQKKIFSYQSEISLHAPTLGIKLSEEVSSHSSSNGGIDKLRTGR